MPLTLPACQAGAKKIQSYRKGLEENYVAE
jgi:hypothetical protein